MVDRLWITVSDRLRRRIARGLRHGEETDRRVKTLTAWRTAGTSKSRLSIDTTIEYRYRVFVCIFQLHYLSHHQSQYQSLCRCLLLSLVRASCNTSRRKEYHMIRVRLQPPWLYSGDEKHYRHFSKTNAPTPLFFNHDLR